MIIRILSILLTYGGLTWIIYQTTWGVGMAVLLLVWGFILWHISREHNVGEY